MAVNEYLLVAYQYNRSPFICRLCSTSSSAVMKHVKAIFEERGVSDILYTDNGMQFTSKKFANFSTTYRFLHKTSSPHYPKSNGFAERMLGVCRRILLKARGTGQDSYLAMMAYRATPMSSNLSPQSELLNGRQIRTPLVSKQVWWWTDKNGITRTEKNQWITGTSIIVDNIHVCTLDRKFMSSTRKQGYGSLKRSAILIPVQGYT